MWNKRIASGILRHHLHIFLEALCAEPQFIVRQAFARALPLLSTFLAPRRSNLAGSPRKRPQRPPSSTWISKANRLRIRGETSDRGRHARVGCWDWHLDSVGEPGQNHRSKTKNGSGGPPWLACPRGCTCNPGVLSGDFYDRNLLINTEIYIVENSNIG